MGGAGPGAPGFHTEDFGGRGRIVLPGVPLRSGTGEPLPGAGRRRCDVAERPGQTDDDLSTAGRRGDAASSDSWIEGGSRSGYVWGGAD